MATQPRGALGRRSLLRFTGGGVVGYALLTACGGEDDTQGAGADAASDPTGTDPEAEPDDGDGPDSPGLSWERVDLGFVSAYVLVRGGQAAVVDTGVEGSADAIGAVLDAAGPGWAGVRYVVLTHKHPDHVGGLDGVLSRATGATGYIGSGDLAAVQSDGLTGLDDGDDVFGLQVVGSPGHTAGHISVFDTAAGVLVAGDALGYDGGLSGSNPEFTEDPDAAAASVRALAALSPSAILVGHGPPVTEDAAAQLSELAASL